MQRGGIVAHVASPWMDTKQAAAYIGVSTKTLIRWRAEGEGPRVYRAGRLCRYRTETIDEWMERDAK